jgi:hypothetical protein
VPHLRLENVEILNFDEEKVEPIVDETEIQIQQNSTFSSQKLVLKKLQASKESDLVLIESGPKRDSNSDKFLENRTETLSQSPQAPKRVNFKEIFDLSQFLSHIKFIEFGSILENDKDKNLVKMSLSKMRNSVISPT